jgi:hypothetical protein
VKKNKAANTKPQLPLTAEHWEHTFQLVCATFAAARSNQPPVQFYSCARNHYDGHLLVVGKDVQPLFLVVVVLGPVAAESLSDYFLSRGKDFVGISCWGDPLSEYNWSAAGALPAAESLSKRERKVMVRLIGSVVKELMERFAVEHMRN